MNDDEFKSWVDSERKKVIKYLEKQRIAEPNVGPWPAFEVSPYFAIWAVESKKIKGKIGWWAFSGDIPTDYVSEDGKCHPRNALKILLNTWNSYMPFLKRGKQPPEMRFGDGNNLPYLAELLEKRISIFTEYLNDDALWDER